MRTLIHKLPSTAVASSYHIESLELPATLWVRPTSGNTLTVEYSTDNGENFQALSALTGATAYAETQVTAGFTDLKITTSGVQSGSWGMC